MAAAPEDGGLAERRRSSVAAAAGVGSIAERRAARWGFKPAPSVSTTRSRCSSPLSSPYLTIPPGLSPAALLDSPVMISASEIQPSPTTGAFSLPLHNQDILESNLETTIEQDEAVSVEEDSIFMFKPPATPLSAIQHPGNQGMVLHQMEFEDQVLSNEHEFKGFVGSPIELGAKDFECKQKIHVDELLDPEDPETQPAFDEDQTEQAFPSSSLGKQSEDGYNWRKYGQKHVKGSEYPRSYYKCTHPNCSVKKKVERSPDSQITEIIYMGKHNHMKPPPPPRRSMLGSPYRFGEIWETVGSQQGSGDRISTDCKVDCLERTSPTSVVTDPSELIIPIGKGRQSSLLETIDINPELSSTLATNCDDDVATQDGSSHVEEGDDEEIELKRRKMDNHLGEAGSAVRALREPRVVVQTDSEVDILDDGYRWRKYGQKVVKGNPNPRSYYKCTHPGCTVRKHVERASHDLKSVITSYEGKHNHEVPSARSNSPSPSSAFSSATAATSLSSPSPDLQPLSYRDDRHRLGLANEFFCPLYPNRAFVHPRPLTVVPFGSFGLGHGFAEPFNSILPSFMSNSFPIALQAPNNNSLVDRQGDGSMITSFPHKNEGSL